MQSIEEKIKAKGVTKAHVAKMVGITPGTLSRIMAGVENYGSKENLKKIHAYLDGLNTDKPL